MHSKWTDVENIKVNQPDVKEINSEQYAQYLQKLRTYKDSEHKFVYASFDNSIKTPFSRGHHLNDIPDSIDIVSLIYPDGLVEFEQKEIQLVTILLRKNTIKWLKRIKKQTRTT